MRLSLVGAGLDSDARVHYGGQARGGAHRLWITGVVLGVERQLCMTLPADVEADRTHLARFVGQVTEQVALMRLANAFRP